MIMMMKMLLLIILATNLVARTIKGGGLLKHQLEDEKAILDNWAKNYVDTFFRPSTHSPLQFRLDQLYVQRDDGNTDSLYRNATKYNFYNEPLVTASNLTEVFSIEKKIVEKSGGKVSQDLQAFLLRRLFSSPRHGDSPQPGTIASYLTIKLGRLGLYTVNQQFKYVNILDEAGSEQSGLNVFGVLPGERWGGEEDQLMVLAAHWDTVPTSPGTNDNGSGVVAVLELARILANSGHKFTNTVIFAFFDKEEVGCEGSRAFVREFVVPLIVGEFGATVQGVYNLDTLLSFSPSPDSQDLDPSWERLDPDLVQRIERNDRRGDFIMTVGRNTSEDSHLAATFAKYLQDYQVNHLKVGPFSYRQPARDQLADNVFALRSDHVRFWYYQELKSEDVLSQFSFPGVLLTDTAYLRGYMRDCYHDQCDTLKNDHVSQDNMEFLASVTTAISRAVLELCSNPEELNLIEPDNSLDDAHVQAKDLAKRKDDGVVRQINYENVQSQINIENLHLTFSDSSDLAEAGGYFYLDPAMSKVKQIINSFYNEANDANSFNSPMVIKLKNDL